MSVQGPTPLHALARYGTCAATRVVIVTALLLPLPALASNRTSNRCAAAKVEASGEFVHDVLSCIVTRGDKDDADCVGRAKSKLAARFIRAEKSGACTTTGDADTVAAALEAAAADLAASIEAASANRCAQRTTKAAADAAQDLFRCNAAAVAKGAGHGVDSACVDTARDRLRASIVRVESHGACSSGSGAAAIVDQHITLLALGGRQTLAPPISACRPIEVTAVHGNEILGNARLARITNGRVACMGVDDGTVASCAFSLDGASGQWVESPQGNYAIAGQAISLQGVPGGDYVIASAVSDGSPAACVDRPSMDTMGYLTPGEEIPGRCLVENMGADYNALSAIHSRWEPLVNFVPLTHEVCSSNNPASSPHPDGYAQLVRSFASAGSSVVDTFCYSGTGAALNDINGMERDVWGNYYSGDNYCHYAANAGFEVPAAKRPATRSLPAPGVVNTRTPILWRPVNPNVTIANPPPSTPGTPVTRCGTVLDRPGQYHLAHDLVLCGGDGVQIAASDVYFTLGGFTISGRSSVGNCNLDDPQAGIRVAAGATGVHISGGTVERFVDGIQIGSHSSVSGMTLRANCVFGLVPGSNTLVHANQIEHNGLDGIVLDGALTTTIRSNTIHSNGRYGIVLVSAADGNSIVDNVLTANGVDAGEGGGVAVIFGSNTTIRRNRAQGNMSGIVLLTDRNIVDGNTAIGNYSLGISVTGAHNLIQENIATANGIVDLVDGAEACGTNIWQSNTFVTDQAGGVSDGGPATGCILGTEPIV